MNENLEKVNENTPKDEEQNVVINRSEKVVVEYRKPSFFMSLLLILIGACFAIGIGASIMNKSPNI